MSELSDHDQAVLNCLFNPNLPILEQVPPADARPVDQEEATPEVVATKTMEIQAIRIVETTADFAQGLALINEALKVAPTRPSLYNNRALILQYDKKFDEALSDLNRALDLIEQGGGATKYAKSYRKAICQRAVLHKRAGRVEEAREDFECAAKLGSQFAKSQLVELNPYAALCNDMLRKVMDAL